MKKHYFLIVYINIIVLSLLLTSSCKKTDSSQPTPPLYGQLWLHLHTDINSVECDSGNIFSDAAGRNEELFYAEFYISNISIYKTDGTPYALPGNLYVLKYIDNEDYYIDSVPTGNYNSVSFNIGLTASVNNTLPSSWSSSSELSSENPVFKMLNMWFGSTSKGYIFLNVQGKADTTVNHNGTVNFPFSYQLGGNSMLNYIKLPNQQFSILPKQVTFIHIVCDYGNLLQGIKLVNSATPFNSDSSVAKQISKRIATNFLHYEAM